MDATLGAENRAHTREDSLLRKYNIPIQNLDFSYVETCTNGGELEKILHILQSGQEGYFPDLTKRTEERLAKVKPNSKYVRKATPVLEKQSLDKEEREGLSEELNVWLKNMNKNSEELEVARKRSGAVNHPDVRKALPASEASEEKKEKRIKSTDYSSWDKYDPDTEILKMDLETEKQKNEIDKESRKKERAVKFSEFSTKAEADFEANREREKGNEFFKSGEYKQAVVCYTNSINYSPSANNYNNRAIARMKLNDFKDAQKDCGAALKYEPRNVKALLRSVQCHEALGEYEEGLRVAEKVIQINPNDTTAQNFINKLNNQLNVKTNAKTRMKVVEYEDKKVKISHKYGSAGGEANEKNIADFVGSLRKGDENKENAYISRIKNEGNIRKGVVIEEITNDGDLQSNSPKKTKISFSPNKTKSFEQNEPDLSKKPSRSILKKRKHVVLPIPGPSTMPEPYFVVVENKDPEIIKKQEFILNNRPQIICLNSIDISGDENDCVEVHIGGGKKSKQTPTTSLAINSKQNSRVAREDVAIHTDGGKRLKETPHTVLVPNSKQDSGVVSEDEEICLNEGIHLKPRLCGVDNLNVSKVGHTVDVKECFEALNEEVKKYLKVDSNEEIKSACEGYERDCTSDSNKREGDLNEEIKSAREGYEKNCTRDSDEREGNSNEEIKSACEGYERNSTRDLNEREGDLNEEIKPACEGYERDYKRDSDERDGDSNEEIKSACEGYKRECTRDSDEREGDLNKEIKSACEGYERDCTRDSNEREGDLNEEENMKSSGEKNCTIDLNEDVNMKSSGQGDSIADLNEPAENDSSKDGKAHLLCHHENSNEDTKDDVQRIYTSPVINSEEENLDCSLKTDKSELTNPKDNTKPQLVVDHRENNLSNSSGNLNDSRNGNKSKENDSCIIINREFKECNNDVPNDTNSNYFASRKWNNRDKNKNVQNSNDDEIVQGGINGNLMQNGARIDQSEPHIVKQDVINVEELHIPFSFLKMWSAIGHDLSFSKHAEVLRNLDYNRLPQVIGYKLDGTMLSVIISTLHSHFMVPHEIDRVWNLLDNLSRMERFGIMSMFLSAKDKCRVKLLFEFLQQHGKPLPEEIMRLYT